MDRLTTEQYTLRIAELAAEGMYEPGKYVKRSDLSAGPITTTASGGVTFDVETTVENEDRQVFEVTITPV